MQFSRQTEQSGIKQPDFHAPSFCFAAAAWGCTSLSHASLLVVMLFSVLFAVCITRSLTSSPFLAPYLREIVYMYFKV